MKNKIIFTFALLSFFVSTSIAQKIGYLNTSELLLLMPEVKKADSVLVRYAEDMQKIYNDYVTEYSQKLNEYNQFSATWSEPKKQAFEEDLRVLNQRISDYENDSNNTLAKKKEELYGPVLDKVKSTIKVVGEENKFIAILDGSALLYAGTESVDILPLVKKKLGLL